MSSEFLMEDDNIIKQDLPRSRSPMVQRVLPQNEVTIDHVPANQNTATTRTNDPLSDTNWTNWHKKICCMLENYNVDMYVRGEVPQPNWILDLAGYKAWGFNDNYAMLVMHGLCISL